VITAGPKFLAGFMQPPDKRPCKYTEKTI